MSGDLEIIVEKENGKDKSFSQALIALKKGKKISRKEWAQHTFLIIQCGRDGKDLVTFLAIGNSFGGSYNWIPDSDAILADDWMIADDSEELFEMKAGIEKESKGCCQGTKVSCTNLTFGEALECLKKGMVVARYCWREKFGFLSLQNGNIFFTFPEIRLESGELSKRELTTEWVHSNKILLTNDWAASNSVAGLSDILSS